MSFCFNIVTHLRSLTVDVPGAVAWCRCWPLVLRAAGGTNPAGRCLIRWWFQRFLCSSRFLGKKIQFDKKHTLQGTNISPKNGILKMIFLFPRWDMYPSPGGYFSNGWEKNHPVSLYSLASQEVLGCQAVHQTTST